MKKTIVAEKIKSLMIFTILENKILEEEEDQVEYSKEEASMELVLSMEKRVIELMTALMRKKEQEEDLQISQEQQM